MWQSIRLWQSGLWSSVPPSSTPWRCWPKGMRLRAWKHHESWGNASWHLQSGAGQFSHSPFSLHIVLCVKSHVLDFTSLLFSNGIIYYCFTQEPPKTEHGKSCPTFFQLMLKKKKKQQKAHNKKSIGLSLTFGNPDILCTKVSDIKADCFHAYISNIICFTSVYAQAS